MAADITDGKTFKQSLRNARGPSSPPAAPRGLFPGGAAPASAPLGFVPGGAAPASAPLGFVPGGAGPAFAPRGLFPGGGVLVLTLLMAALVSCASAGKTLVISDADTGRIYGKWPIGKDFSFAVEFVHSVNQSPVRDTFTVRDGEILPLSTRFSAFGAGMQSDLEPGQSLSRDGDALVITGFTRAFPELRFIVGTVSDHILFIQGESVSLRDLCGRNAHIVVKTK